MEAENARGVAEIDSGRPGQWRPLTILHLRVTMEAEHVRRVAIIDFGKPGRWRATTLLQFSCSSLWRPM